MDDAVRKLADDSGVLRRISGHRQPEGYALLDLGFTRALRVRRHARIVRLIAGAGSWIPPYLQFTPGGQEKKRATNSKPSSVLRC